MKKTTTTSNSISLSNHTSPTSLPLGCTVLFPLCSFFFLLHPRSYLSGVAGWALGGLRAGSASVLGPGAPPFLPRLSFFSPAPPPYLEGRSTILIHFQY